MHDSPLVLALKNLHLPDLSQLPPTEWFDNSRLEAFQKCNRLAWYQDVLNLDQSSAAMAAGTVFHKGIEVLSSGASTDTADLALAKEWTQFQPLFRTAGARFQLPAMHAVFMDYQKKWANDPLQYLMVEVPLAYFYNGDFCRPPFWLVGRADGLAYRTGKIWLVERKTTGAIRPDFLGNLSVGTQKFQYLFILSMLLQEMGLNPREHLGGIIFDCIGWSATKTEFARHEVMMPNPAQFEEWLMEAFDTITQIRASYTAARDTLPKKRRGQCYVYGKCAFIDICEAFEVQTGLQMPGLVSNFRKRTWKPI